MLNCENLQSNLPLYIDDVLSDDERRSIENHLPTCPLCRQKLSEYKELRNNLRMVSRPVIPNELLQSIRKAVAVELEVPTIKTGTEVEPTLREKFAHWIMPYSIGTVAASVLAFFLLSVLLTTRDVTTDLIAQNQDPQESTIMITDSNPEKTNSELILPTDYDNVMVAGYPPRVNPTGALVALTKSIVRGKMNDEEVVIVANVFNNGDAQIDEVVEPPSDELAMANLKKAFRTDSSHSPFLPAKYNGNTKSMPVVIKLQMVDVIDKTPKPKKQKRK